MPEDWIKNFYDAKALEVTDPEQLKKKIQEALGEVVANDEDEKMRNLGDIGMINKTLQYDNKQIIKDH